MSTYMPGFQSFFKYFESFLLAKLATSSIRVKFTCLGMSLLVEGI